MTFFLRTGALVSAIALLAAAPPSSSAIDAAAAAAAQAVHAPGAQVVVVKDGTLLLDRGYGFANVAARVPVTAQTQFEVGSITKEFTAAAILQLKEAGRLSLTDPLGKYVPEYARGKNVTLEQLLWQVSGVPEYLATNHFRWISGHRPGGVLQAIAMIKNKPLEFAPGSKWKYSNTNYMLLGAVVARVSHMPWRTYIRKNIYARAGMTHSAFIQDESRLPHMATGYNVTPKGTLVKAPPLLGAWAGGAGAIVSTAGDLAKWDAAFFSGKIVSMADVNLATTAHMLPSGKSTDYGFGWAVDRFEGQPHISHDGGTWGFLSENDYYPTLHECVIAFANSDMAPPDMIAAAAFNALNPQIAASLDTPAPGENPTITALAREWTHRLQTGDIDRSQLTPQMSAFLKPADVPFFENQLGALGPPSAFIYRGKKTAGNVTAYSYRVKFKGTALTFVIAIDNAGKIAGLDFRN